MIDKTSKIEHYKHKVKNILDYARGSNKNKITIYQVENDFAQFYDGEKLLPIARDLGFDSTTDFLKVCGFKVDGACVSTMSGGVVDSGVDNVISLMQRTAPKAKQHDSFHSLMSFRTQAKKYLSSIVRHQNDLTPDDTTLNSNVAGYGDISFSRKHKDTPSSISKIFDKKSSDLKKLVDVSEPTNPFVKPLPHLSRGSVLKVDDYLKSDFSNNVEQYYFQQYNEEERAQLLEYAPRIEKFASSAPEKSNKSSITSIVKEENDKVLWTVVGKVKNVTTQLTVLPAKVYTAYFLCRTLCEDILTIDTKLQEIDRTRIVFVDPNEVEVGIRCIVILNNTFCRGTVVDRTERNAVVRLYDYDTDIVKVSWDKVYHAPNGVFTRNPLCAWILLNEKNFELGDTVEVDFGSKLSSYKYRDYYDTKRIIRT